MSQKVVKLHVKQLYRNSESIQFWLPKEKSCNISFLLISTSINSHDKSSLIRIWFLLTSKIIHILDYFRFIMFYARFHHWFFCFLLNEIVKVKEFSFIERFGWGSAGLGVMELDFVHWMKGWEYPDEIGKRVKKEI